MKLNLRRPKLVIPLLVLAGGVVLSAVLFATASEVQRESLPQSVPAVRVVVAEPRPVRLTVRSQGTVAPRTESELVAEVAGPVVWISPALVAGGFFEEGAPLLRLDRRDYQTALARARAALARAESERTHARAALKRITRLAQSDIASPAQLDDTRRSARVAEAGLQEARAQLQQARRDLGRTEIRAPYKGRVREKRVDVGQFLARGQSVATIYATDYVEVRLPVPDRDLAYLELPLFGPGAQDAKSAPGVQLRANFAGADHEWTGRVVRTEGEIDAQSRMVHVVARVEDPYGAAARDEGAPLAVGLFVRAEIAGPQRENVVVLPRSALREDGSILVVDGENRLRRREAEVLRVDREQALLSGAELAGLRICISPPRAFVEGMMVRVADALEAGPSS